jgi:flagella basal body P-ring formation protein FlgA
LQRNSAVGSVTQLSKIFCMAQTTRLSLIRQLALALPMVLATLAALTTPARSATSHPAPLSGSARPVIERFLLSQTAGLPGKVGISIDTPMSGALPPCEALEPFLPSGARLWGRVSVGVRCNGNQPWTRYVPAYIAVVGTYYVATSQINAGQALTPADAAVREGDLTRLPSSVIVDPAQLNGVIASNRIASGAPLRRELLRAVAVVQQGQTVKVVTQGTGFVISTEGKAMTNAAVGAIVQVKMQGGQLLSGIVRPDGMVERPN